MTEGGRRRKSCTVTQACWCSGSVGRPRYRLDDIDFGLDDESIVEEPPLETIAIGHAPCAQDEADPRKPAR